MSAELDIQLLGRIPYDAAWDLQKKLVAERSDDPYLTDKLLLLEHPHTYTLGRHGGQENLIFDEQTRREKGIALYHVDRGGDVTYHGPGQLVGYPILNLKNRYGKGIGRIRSYVCEIEKVLLDTLQRFGITARLYDGFRGVWVEEDGELNKVAAIGVYVNNKGVSSHGFALNANTDLSYFDGIVPCGIADHGVTSMSRLLGRDVTVEEVIPAVIASFTAVFDYDIEHEGLVYAHH